MIQLKIDESRVLAYLAAMPNRVNKSVLDAVNAATIDLQGYIRREKLHGGDPLHSRTGNLSRAVTVQPARQEPGRVVGSVFVDRTAPYGFFHEYGVDHSWTIVPKTKKVLAFTVGGETVFVRKVVHPGLKERSFMRASLTENREKIVARLTAAVVQGIK
jgi:hypothetical protein